MAALFSNKKTQKGVVRRWGFVEQGELRLRKSQGRLPNPFQEFVVRGRDLISFVVKGGVST